MPVNRSGTSTALTPCNCTTLRTANLSLLRLVTRKRSDQYSRGWFTNSITIKTRLAPSDHRAASSFPSKLDLRLSSLSSKEEIHGLVSPHCIFSDAMRLIQIVQSQGSPGNDENQRFS